MRFILLYFIKLGDPADLGYQKKLILLAAGEERPAAREKVDY